MTKKAIFEIDWETADRIAIDSMIEHRNLLKEQLKKHKKKKCLHDEDVAFNTIMIEHFNKVIEYYGG